MATTMAEGGGSRNIAIAAVGNLGAPIAAFVSAPILAQVLGVDARGEVAAITAPVLLAASAITFGLPEAITFFVARGAGRHRALVGRGLLLLLGCGALGWAALAVLGEFLFSGPNASIAFLISFAIVPMLLLGGLRGYAAGRSAWSLVALERAIGAVVRLALVAGLAVANSLTVFTASVSIAVSAFVGAIAYLMLLRRPHGAVLTSGDELRGGRDLLGYGSRIWIGSLAGVFLSRLDQTLMIPLSSAYELGLYAVAVSVSEVTLVFNSAVRDVIFSQESARADLRRLALAARVSTALTVLMAGLVGLASWLFLPALFGAEFDAASGVVLVLLLGIVLGNPGSVAGAGLSARGRPELRSYSLIIACIANVALVIALVPVFGAIGAAVATVAGNVIAGYMNVFWVKRSFGGTMRGFILFGWADIKESVGLVMRLVGKASGSEGKA
ncbi:oligosaccharide flippase family protein [Plantibacter sp. CFBP 8775]|uniref:oligosaccharide flippase family protein n=1 Tax=Plantibacter sp. CFBP 8775 TaxID=2774038 RepID=UPI001781310D|nr:oligosaccharide flippase family protein [Plantibacter sp. CFBP 8775]MBD8104054.1 oligosaccharide flippase family protein [Plantibacter sp. CFBP 8775]